MQLHPKAVFYFMIQTSLAWLFFSIGVVLFFGDGMNIATPKAMGGIGIAGVILKIVLVFFILSIFNWLYCQLKFRSYKIELKNEGVALDYGIISQTHEVLLFDKIQDILITRNLLERLMGLSTMIIQNAMGEPEIISGVDGKEVETFRDQVLSRTNRR